MSSGKLDQDVVQSIWDMPRHYESTAEKHGLELWDHQPEPAPDGLVKSAVSIGALDQEIAKRMSAPELNAALAHAWDPASGELDQNRALTAAMDLVAGSPDPERVIASRGEPRCGAPMPRAKAPCIRRRNHAGSHRAVR